MAAPGTSSPPSWRWRSPAPRWRCDRTPTHPQVLIVRDTRESGEMLESAIAAGVTAAGGDALLAGVLPTPAAPLLVRRHGLTARGRDLGLAQPLRGQRDQAVRRRRLQARRRHRARDRGGSSDSRPPRTDADRPRRAGSTAPSRTTCASCTRASRELDLSGRRVLLDCANGATFRAAPEIFRRLGAEVERDRRRARRPQHQRRLRLDPPRAR